jgi:hypothetical protein
LTHDIAPFSFPDSVNQLMLSQYLWKRPELTMSFPVRGVKLPAEGHADDTVRSAVLAGSDLASVLRIVAFSASLCQFAAFFRPPLDSPSCGFCRKYGAKSFCRDLVSQMVPARTKSNLT